MKKFFEGAAITFAIGFVIFLGVLLITSRANAAATCADIPSQVIPGLYWWENGAHDADDDGIGCDDNASIGVTADDTANMLVKGSFADDFWYVNLDETSRKPVSTDSGLVFGPADLIHHEADLPLASLTGGSFVASPEPSAEFDFSVEVRDLNSNYGTLRWDGSQWSITIGPYSAGDPDGPVDEVTPGTFTDASPVDLLAGKRSKWGTADFDGTTKIVSFGVGYTNSPPGTIETVVSSVTFGSQTISLAAPAPTPVISTVPGPVVTQVVTVIVTPSVSASVAPSPSVTVTPTPSRTTVVPVAPAGNSGSSDGNGFPWKEVGIGGALVAAGGATLAAMAVARRRNRQSSEPEAPEYDEAMREFDAALESLHPDSGAEGPGKHSVDNAPTQAIPYVDNGDAETETLPRQE